MADQPLHAGRQDRRRRPSGRGGLAAQRFSRCGFSVGGHIPVAMIDAVDDSELLVRYSRERDDDAFAEIVRRYVGLVYQVALRLNRGDAHSAQDVTQRVFTLLARKASSLKRHRTIAGWLHTTTRFVSAESRRAEQRRRTREQNAYIMQEVGSEGAFGSHWEQLRPILDETLGELSEADREVVLLRFFASLPFAKIGEKLSVSENAARMRLERALERLRVLVARRGIASTAAALAVVLETQPAVAIPTGFAASITTTALGCGAAPAGVAAWVGATGLMSSLKLSMVVGAVLLLAAALGVATYETRSHRRTATTLANANHELATMTARLKQLQRDIALAEKERADLKQEIEETRAARATPSAGVLPAESSVAASWDPIEQGRIFMDRHPSVRRALDAYGKARAHFRYSPIYSALGLRPDQIEEFQSLMSGGFSMGASGFEGPYSNRSLSLVTSGPIPNSEEYKERMRVLIGEEGVQKLSQYGLITSGRDLASKVAGELWSTDSPLTVAQADKLIPLFTQHRSSRSAMPGSRIPGYDWDAILTQANTFLSESQLEVLRGMQAREQFVQAINRTTPRRAAAETQAKSQSKK